MPLLEYGDVIFDNCTLYSKQDLHIIQNEAARIAITTPYNEICWETLELYKLTLFYKVMRNITLLYLSSLVPPSVSNLSCYNLRNLDYLQTEDARTNPYYNSCRRVSEHGIIHLLMQSNVNL